MIGLPEIIENPKYEGQWEFDGWKIKVKPNAHYELKAAVDEWMQDIEEAMQSEDGAIIDL